MGEIILQTFDRTFIKKSIASSPEALTLWCVGVRTNSREPLSLVSEHLGKAQREREAGSAKRGSATKC